MARVSLSGKLTTRVLCRVPVAVWSRHRRERPGGQRPVLQGDVLRQVRTAGARRRPSGHISQTTIDLGVPALGEQLRRLFRLPRVKPQGLHLGHVGAQRAVHPRAVDAEEHALVHRRPVWPWTAAVRAVIIARQCKMVFQHGRSSVLRPPIQERPRHRGRRRGRVHTASAVGRAKAGTGGGTATNTASSAGGTAVSGGQARRQSRHGTAIRRRAQKAGAGGLSRQRRERPSLPQRASGEASVPGDGRRYQRRGSMRQRHRIARLRRRQKAGKAPRVTCMGCLRWRCIAPSRQGAGVGYRTRNCGGRCSADAGHLRWHGGYTRGQAGSGAR